ncbi:hypothetical protein PR202_gb02080 [Eleusine coracana subsp. coracana]|uniref:Exoribonuclease phosphorolytic domain-containing protein n=1 Tax=Eleusine coracana subsp. coracana TaxID=191504 RepID=A0AAV5DYA0_ELECO|nr:hypothetical protein PR202_gb02080 [Eleusine coracana subsp. coracana]
MEYVNPLTGFRVDGRRPNEMRQLKGEIGVVARADGSALFEMGNTRVIAAVYGPREVQNKGQLVNSKEALIDIFVQVLQADGGTRSACINAATLALADAGIPMRDIVTSCSAGYLCSTPLLEDSAGGADVTVGILAKTDKVTLLQVLLENTKRLECQRG